MSYVNVRLVEISKIILLLPPIPVQSCWGPEAILVSLGVRRGPAIDRIPLHCRAHSRNPHSLVLGRFRHTGSTHMHIFGTWEETEAPRENPHRHGQNVPAPHKQRPWPGIDFCFLTGVIMKGHWTKRCYSRTCCILTNTVHNFLLLNKFKSF